MALIPWSERGALATLRPELDSWIDQLFRSGLETSRLPAALRGPVPPVNLAETDKELVATIELPGMDEKDIEVEVLGDQLVVRGERKWEHEAKEREFHRVESQYGSFRRTLQLPRAVVTAADAVRATFAKGVLEVRMPKAEPKAPGKVKIHSR